MAAYQIARDGEALGTFTEQEIRAKEATGELRPTDHILKNRAGQPFWFLLSTHSPKSDFFQNLSWTDCQKQHKIEQQKAETYLKEFINLAAFEEDKVRLKETCRRIDEYQDLLIYLAGMLAREKARRDEEDRVLDEEERESDLNDYSGTLIEELDFTETEEWQAERHVSWLSGAFRGTKPLQTYDDFLKDPYWSHNFSTWWKNITEKQKKDFWDIFKNCWPSEEDIRVLAILLTLANRDDHPTMIISFCRGDRALSPLRMTATVPRNPDDDLTKLKIYKEQIEEKQVAGIIGELAEIIRLAKDGNVDDADFGDHLKGFSWGCIDWCDIEDFRKAFRRLNAESGVIKKVASEIVSAFKESRDLPEIPPILYKNILKR